MAKPNTKNDTSKVVNMQTGKEKWKAFAAMPNARVVICNAPETYAMADLARSADMSLNLMRKRLMVTISPEEALPMMEKFNKQIIELEQVIAEICKKVNVRYRMPKNITNIRKQMGLEVDEEETTEKPVDTKVPAKKTAKDSKAA